MDPHKQSMPISSATSEEASPLENEQELIRSLYSAIARLRRMYGSQNGTARALGVSSALLTRASEGWLQENTVDQRLPRPQNNTLQKLAVCGHASVEVVAKRLIARRGIPGALTDDASVSKTLQTEPSISA